MSSLPAVSPMSPFDHAQQSIVDLSGECLHFVELFHQQSESKISAEEITKLKDLAKKTVQLIGALSPDAKGAKADTLEYTASKIEAIVVAKDMQQLRIAIGEHFGEAVENIVLPSKTNDSAAK